MDFVHNKQYKRNCVTLSSSVRSFVCLFVCLLVYSSHSSHYLFFLFVTLLLSVPSPNMAFYNTDKWQLRYQRNNKQNGLKNIRCFPYCSDPHRLSGFCGHSLVFLLGELLPSNATRTNFLAYGEFTLKDSKTIHQGDVITREIALSNQRRNGDDLFKPWFPGDVELIDRQIIFNKQKKGWHYSWISNKHTSESMSFGLLAFEELAGGGGATKN